MFLVIKCVGQAYIHNMNNVQILKITKMEITVKKPRKSMKFMISSIISIVILTIVLSFEGLSSISSGMVHIYNPVNSLYNDTGDVVFTSGGIIEKEMLDFIIPIKGARVEVSSNGEVLFYVSNSIMVKSPESGVIDEVGFTNDGKKYIKIRHTIEMYSIISNVDIIGVSVGVVVNKGTDIATAKENDIVTMQILENNIPLTNIKVNQSKIIWKD